MPAIVTPEMLVNHMSGITLTPGQNLDVESTLERIEGELVEYLNRPVQITEITETLVDEHLNTCYPSVNPVHEIVSVDNYSSVANFGLGFYDPVLKGHGGIFLPGSGSYKITYRGGLDGPNIPALKSFILRVAAREMVSSHDDVASIKDLNSEVPPDMVKGPTEQDYLRVQRFQRLIVRL